MTGLNNMQEFFKWLASGAEDGLIDELEKVDVEIRKRLINIFNRRVQRSFMAGAIAMGLVEAVLWGAWCSLQ